MNHLFSSAVIFISFFFFLFFLFFFFNDTATTEIYTLSLHDALPIFPFWCAACPPLRPASRASSGVKRCALPLAWAALPPLLAISRRLFISIDPKPRLLLSAMMHLLLTG